MITRLFPLIGSTCLLVMLPAYANPDAPATPAADPPPAEKPAPPADTAAMTEAEAAFAAMLTNATLRGSWAPIDKSLLGEEHKDGYRILQARKLDGNRWALMSRLKFQGQEITVPFPVTVHFAGDAAVLVLDNIPLADGSLWSARVLFHDDVYAGSWWGANKAEKSGVISGTITREPAP